MRGPVVLAVVAVSCGPRAPGRQPAPPMNTAGTAPRAASCPAPPADLDTEPAAGIRFEAPGTAELRCDEYRRHCVATLAVTITNCRPDPIVAVRGGFASMDQPYVTIEGLPHRVAPGGSWTYEASTRGEGMVAAPIMVESTVYRWSTYVPPGQPGTSGVDRTKPETWTVELGPAPIRVTNPARDAAVRACRACNGDWGHHYMMVTIDPSPGADNGEDCRCRSTDFGLSCKDGDECQGWCEQDQFVVVGHVGAVDIGYAVGSCSEFTSQASCASPIPSGASRKPPGPREDTMICVD